MENDSTVEGSQVTVNLRSLQLSLYNYICRIARDRVLSATRFVRECKLSRKRYCILEEFPIQTCMITLLLLKNFLAETKEMYAMLALQLSTRKGKGNPKEKDYLVEIVKV